MKIITICGSLRFENEMKFYAEKLELEGNCVLSVIYGTRDKDEYSIEEINSFGIGHFKRIDISDSIFVVNKNGYIGEAVKNEIDYARKHNKEIMYLENVDNENNIEYYYKLVRDKVITIIEKSGRKANYSKLNNEDYLNELFKKLIEEVNEFTKEKSKDELADVFEVIYAIMKSKNIDINEIEKIRFNKKLERGGFEDKIFLKEIIN